MILHTYNQYPYQVTIPYILWFLGYRQDFKLWSLRYIMTRQTNTPLCPFHNTGGITHGDKFYLAVKPILRTTHIFRDLMYPQGWNC